MQESIVFLVRVQCRRKESSRSLSHLMSFLLLSSVCTVFRRNSFLVYVIVYNFHLLGKLLFSFFHCVLLLFGLFITKLGTTYTMFILSSMERAKWTSY